jgi:hypothetical protein
MYCSELTEVGKAVTLTLRGGRMAYLLCVEGARSVTITKGGRAADTSSLQVLVRHDAVELQGTPQTTSGEEGGGGAVDMEVTVAAVEVEQAGANATKAAHFILFEMAQDGRGGRHDL